MPHLSRSMTLALGGAVIAGAIAGAAIRPPDAFGYPAGAAVSYGANPVWSTAFNSHWYVNATAPKSGELVAPADQDLVITDVVFTVYNSQQAAISTTTDCGRIPVHLAITQGATPLFATYAAPSAPVIARLEGGLRIPSGTTATWTLTHVPTCSPHDVVQGVVSLTGYYAAP